MSKVKHSKSQSRIHQHEKNVFKQEVEKLRKDYSNTHRFKQIKHQEKSKSLKAIPTTKLSQNSGKFLQSTKIISVTASKWAVFDYFTNKYIRGYRTHDQYNLSIFSKLLVFATVNTLITKHKIDITRFQCIVTHSVHQLFPHQRQKQKQNSLTGSNIVNLQVDDILSLEDLLHLLIISEAEEPELVLAVNFGAYLQKKRKKQYYSVFDADDNLFIPQIKEFYSYVNSYCQTMKLQNIKYVEFHPRNKNERNKCSAFDVASLSTECLKIPLFEKMIKLKEVEVTIKYINEDGVMADRNEILVNKTISNKFLSYVNIGRNWDEKQFMDSHCSVYYEQEGLAPVIVVALGSYSPNDREKDIQQIIEWYIKNYSKKKPTNVEASKVKVEEKIVIRNEKQDRMLPRFKTQLTDELETILEQKLRVSDIGIKNKKLGPIIEHKKSKKRTITQIV